LKAILFSPEMLEERIIPEAGRSEGRLSGSQPSRDDCP
jgi:hypothetical protein